MAPKNKTRDRIVEASLELFNAQGERSVTTNHIAAHLGMSPGNLYYHFRNKQAIIAELFAQYADRVNAFLRPPQGRALTDAQQILRSRIQVNNMLRPIKDNRRRRQELQAGILGWGRY